MGAYMCGNFHRRCAAVIDAERACRRVQCVTRRETCKVGPVDWAEKMPPVNRRYVPTNLKNIHPFDSHSWHPACVTLR